MKQTVTVRFTNGHVETFKDIDIIKDMFIDTPVPCVKLVSYQKRSITIPLMQIQFISTVADDLT